MLPAALFAVSALLLQSGRVFLSVPDSQKPQEYLLVSQIVTPPAGSEMTQWQIYQQGARFERANDGCRVDLQGSRSPIVFAAAVRGACDISDLFLADWRTHDNECMNNGPRGDFPGIRVDPGASRVLNVRNYADRLEADITQELVFPDGRRTVGLRFTLWKLPDTPQTPVRADPRVCNKACGDFAIRRRLRTDRPLVYWIDSSTPREWVEYVKRGIEDWEPAFRAAGFPNGIQARVAGPGDASLSPQRSAYFHWIKGKAEYSNGPSLVDPRSGEIVASEIVFFAGVLKRLAGNYFVLLAPLDPAAREYPPSHAEMGRRIRTLVAHETGHTLGFMHNGKAAAGYSIENLRDRHWLERMHASPTVMTYAWQDYIAQPEDRIPPELLRSGVGPTDIWSFQWLYGNRAVEWERELEQQSWLRASPGSLDSEDLEDRLDGIGMGDPTRAADLAERNLIRVVALMHNPVADLPARVAAQWMDIMVRVALVPGGRRVVAVTPERRYAYPARDEQLAAINFLVKHALATPEFLLGIDEPGMARKRIEAAQLRILGTLLSSKRLEEMSRLGAPVQTAEMVRLMGDALFSSGPDEYRSRLQHLFVEILSARSWAIAQDELRRLIPRAPDPMAARMTDLLSGRAKPEVEERAMPGLFPSR